MAMLKKAAMGILIIGVLGALAAAWLVPNRLWSSRALIEGLDTDSLLLYPAKEALLRRDSDRELVIPALVGIAGGCRFSTVDIYHSHPERAAARLCQLKDPSAVPLLEAELQKRASEKCDSLHNPDAVRHLSAALDCLRAEKR